MLERKKAITLKDVARVASTTPMTVSNVLNNRAGAVSAALAAEVRRVATELGYRPHAPARRLRTQRNQVIGVVLVDTSPYFLSDPLTSAILAGMTATLSRRGYGTVLHGIRPDEVETASFVRENETDGICLLLSGPEAARNQVVERVVATGQPLILVQERLSDDVKDGACVYFDDRRGARALARQLITGSRQEIMMIVPSLEWPAMQQRQAGMRETIAENSMTHLTILRSVDESFDACQAAMEGHISKVGLPDVVVGGNDQIAIAAMKYLQSVGKKIPEDVQVAGFNGLEFGRYSTPELTTVVAPAFALGEATANAMLHRLDKGGFPFRELVMPVELALRGSTRSASSPRLPKRRT